MSRQWQTADFQDLSLAQLYAALRLRMAVFAVEQASIYQDLDNRDQQAAHILCWQGDQLLAYQRCLAPGVSYPESSLGRIVVAPEARGLQLGKELVQRGIKHNLQRWPESGLRISAQAYLEGFYQQLGFATKSEPYGEDGIPHIQMLYQLSVQIE